MGTAPNFVRTAHGNHCRVIHIALDRRGWILRRFGHAYGPLDGTSAAAVLAYWGVAGASTLLLDLAGPSKFRPMNNAVRSLPPVHPGTRPSFIPQYLV